MSLIDAEDYRPEKRGGPSYIVGKEYAARFNQGKPRLNYILRFPKVMEAISRIKELGAAKYGDDNWKKGGKPDTEYIDSMLRHLTAFMAGEEIDEDSGCCHLGHAIWNLMALLELNHPDVIIDEKLFWERIEHWGKNNV